MDDTGIIDLFLRRDEKALAETESAYGAKLYRMATRITGSSEDAKEIVNDTYLKAWNTIPPQKPAYFFAYLAKICRHLAFGKLDWAHAKKRNADIVELTAEMEQCIPDRTAETNSDAKELGRLLNHFLGELPQESRLIFLRRYWYADSVREISLRYGISESKVKTRLHRIRRKLHDFLKSEGIYV